MSHIKVLDCTLRDGGYVVDAVFGDTAIKGIIKGLADSNIDVIECGFLKDEPHKEGTTIFNNAQQVKEYLPDDKKDNSYVLLADYSRYTIDNLEPYDGTSIDGVRACFFKHERYDVIDFCKEIIKKGYKLYVQPVDVLGYTDVELIELINNINEIEPYAFSIVDTFGSMYKHDLQRIFYLVHHNLGQSISLGFHSHNNMQMSFALSQEFAEMSMGLRNVVIDATMCGMGRGAGNTNTELVLDYLNKMYMKNYDIDSILDVIDNYIDNIKNDAEWGYSIPFYLAGSYSSHVNNISYLLEKASISSKDIRYILNRLSREERKRYEYDLLESIYFECISSKIDDINDMDKLSKSIDGRDILIIMPGKSVTDYEEDILEYINKKNPVVISVNLIPDKFKTDFLYFSNKQKYNYWNNDKRFKDYNKIITSNIKNKSISTECVISFHKLIKCGWENLDNSGVLLLRLLDMLKPNSIAIAGFDGYSNVHSYNYLRKELGNVRSSIQYDNVNKEIKSMLIDYKNVRINKSDILFVTPSRFSDIFM